MGDKFLTFLGEKIIPHFAVIVVSMGALTTSAVAGVKLIQEFPGSLNPESNVIASDEKIIQIKPEKETNTSEENIPTKTPTQTPMATITPKGNFPPANRISNNSNLSNTTNSTNSTNSCIITLFGKQYNITKLLTTHSGGNVFQCGTDMTTVYQGKHGTSVSRMQSYLVSANSPNTPNSPNSPNIPNTPKSSIVNDNDQEHEEEQEERRNTIKEKDHSSNEERDDD